MVRKVVIGKKEIGIVVDFIHDGKVVASVNVFISGSIFVNEADRIVVKKNNFLIANEEGEITYMTIARKVEKITGE